MTNSTQRDETLQANMLERLFGLPGYLLPMFHVLWLGRLVFQERLTTVSQSYCVRFLALFVTARFALNGKTALNIYNKVSGYITMLDRKIVDIGLM